MSTEFLVAIAAIIFWVLWIRLGVRLSERDAKRRKEMLRDIKKNEEHEANLQKLHNEHLEKAKLERETYLKSPEGLVKQAFDKANRLHIFDLLSVFTNHRNAFSYDSSKEIYPIEMLSSERIKPTDPVPLNYDESQFELYDRTFLHFSFNGNTFSIGTGRSFTYGGYRIFLFCNGDLKMSPKLIKNREYFSFPYSINKSDKDLDQVIKLDNWITEVKPLRDEIETARKNYETNQKKLLRKAIKDKVRRNIDLGD